MTPRPRTTPGGASEAAVDVRTDSRTGEPSQTLLEAVETRDGASGANTEPYTGIHPGQTALPLHNHQPTLWSL